MLFPRMISEELRAYAAQFPALVLTGPRQCGKSTLLRELFPQAAILDLDDPLTLSDTQRDPALALTIMALKTENTKQNAIGV